MKLIQILSLIVIHAGIANGFFFPLLFWHVKKGSTSSKSILGWLLVCLSLIVLRIYYFQPFLFDLYGIPFYILGPFIFLLGPLLYFYIRSIVQEDNIVIKNDWVHFVPVSAYLLIYFPLLILGWDSDYSIFVFQFLSSPWILLIAQLTYYLIKINRLVKENRTRITESYSNLEGVELNWTKPFIWTLIIILLFIMIASPLLAHGMSVDAYIQASSVFFALAIFFFAYKAFLQRLPEPQINFINQDNAGYPESLEDIKEDLLDHMEKHKPYLDPELSLVSLAYQLGLSRNQLSQVINTAIGDNFYHFVNQYRIEEVKRLMQEDKNRTYTILALAQDAGFKSKSSFNAIFKKIEGLTPSEYRDRHI